MKDYLGIMGRYFKRFIGCGAMKIRKGCVVSMHYTLTDDAGGVIDTSIGYEPLEYVHGQGEIIPGLEAFLEGEDAGFAGKVAVAPADAYGEHNIGLLLAAKRENFPDDMELFVGMQVQTELPDGTLAVFQVTEVSESAIKLDANHPLAGKTLHFDVDVLDVQDGALVSDGGS
jgi:FKBP-type peptidyl-prolyl cis-trans isomerase SlyD